jgi:hypothetical protein
VDGRVSLENIGVRFEFYLRLNVKKKMGLIQAFVNKEAESQATQTANNMLAKVLIPQL